jgi:hypothetical protein
MPRRIRTGFACDTFRYSFRHVTQITLAKNLTDWFFCPGKRPCAGGRADRTAADRLRPGRLGWTLPPASPTVCTADGPWKSGQNRAVNLRQPSAFIATAARSSANAALDLWIFGNLGRFKSNLKGLKLFFLESSTFGGSQAVLSSGLIRPPRNGSPGPVFESHFFSIL